MIVEFFAAIGLGMIILVPILLALSILYIINQL